MQSSSLSISEALSAEEVCPLCLDRYTAADECLCVVCRAPSCPGCAEAIDADGAMRCFACRPVLAGLPTAAREHEPLSLPRPISIFAQPRPERLPGEVPPLPFPLTTSPYGVRQLKPQPTGSVFVGLPPVPPALQRALPEPRHAAPPPAPPSSAAPAWLSRTQAMAERVRAQLSQRAHAAALQLHAWKVRGAQHWQRAGQEWPGYRAALLRWCQIGLARSRQLGGWSRAHLARPLGVLAAQARSRSKALLPARTKPVTTRARNDNTGPVGV